MYVVYSVSTLGLGSSSCRYERVPM